jgi:hypothetical protein
VPLPKLPVVLEVTWSDTLAERFAVGAEGEIRLRVDRCWPTTLDVDTGSYIPSGYCPHCGHAIDPGVCSECGREVDFGQLRDRPLRETPWLKVTLFAVVFVGAFVGYQRGDWIRHVPTSALLWAQGDSSSRTANELGRRFGWGLLSDAETESFVTNAVQISPESTIRDPYPAGEMIRFGLEVSSQLPWRTVMHSVTAARVFANDTELLLTFAGSQGVGVHTHHFVVGPLDPGQYHLKLRGTLTVSANAMGGRAGWTRRFESVVRFTVVEKPLTSFVDAVYGDDSVLEVRGGIRVVAKAGTNGKYVTVGVWTADDLPPIVGDAYWRRVPDQEWIAAFGSLGDRKFRLTCELVSASTNPASAIGSHIDFKIVGNAKRAFDAGFDEYFAGVIEWTQIPVDHSGKMTFSVIHRNEETRTPTRVYPLEGEEGDGDGEQ